MHCFCEYFPQNQARTKILETKEYTRWGGGGVLLLESQEHFIVKFAFCFNIDNNILALCVSFVENNRF